MEKLDINGRIENWNKLKEQDKKGISGLIKHNSDTALKFLRDFELGINTPKINKGRRSPATLQKLRSICIFIQKNFPEKKFEQITKIELHSILDKMARGEIMKTKTKRYRGVGDFVKNLKTFYGWMLRTKQIKINPTEDLSQAEYKEGKPPWVYLTHEQMKLLIDSARGDYRALILFLYDSGIRPQEAYRLIVSDFNEDFTELNIPEKRESNERVSKTFERTIKLKQSSQLIKNYVISKNLKPDDLFIKIQQATFNKYLRQLSEKLFGKAKTKARGKYNELKLYDIRHISSIFWLDKYQTNKDLMYRMGWTKEDKIYYYSEFLGRRDRIDDDDMITKENKNEYEKKIKMLCDISYLLIQEKTKRISDQEFTDKLQDFTNKYYDLLRGIN